VSVLDQISALWRPSTTKDVVPPTVVYPPDWRSGGYSSTLWGTIKESFTGAWQRNIEVTNAGALTNPTVYACISLISSDIGKLWVNLVELIDTGGHQVWIITENPAYTPVLRKPNHYQNRIKFFEQWMISKLTHGNTYVLKSRDLRGVVDGLYILDPQRVRPVIAPDGAVYYQLDTDYLSGLEEKTVTVPAREIIHDIMCAMYHPLCGLSPLVACALAATSGLQISRLSNKFFGNGMNMAGVLTAPGAIGPDTEARIRAYWESNYVGEAAIGKVAVLGDGLKFEPMVMTAVNAQLVEQLKFSGEDICRCFHVPAYMVGVGPMPNYNNIEALNQQYYAQCLQNPIECIELCLEEGLELRPGLGVQFDLDALLRMDTPTAVKASSDAINAGFLTPNEAREKFDLKPVPGGDTPYLQMQNYSLSALNKRDTREDPFAKTGGTKPQPQLPAAPEPEDEPTAEDVERTMAILLRKELQLAS
jgi:HK97 family phage portal protein